jgi:SAM-dependent methyltransferase
MEIVRTRSELDAKIAECDRARSDEAMRALFSTFRMQVPENLPADPFAAEYRDKQLALYEEIAGIPYSLENEATKFDIEAALQRPFPYNTGSSATAGEYFMSIGFVLNVMALQGEASILEFGPGWGVTTLHLAKLGHKVTVIEIEPCFCELIRRTAEQAGVNIEVINADFFHIENETRKFDAVLFYDCFHHCADHMRLLKALDNVVSPNGRVFFGGEPISNEFSFPWGLRLDGWALWGIRKQGWMELGFREDYFSQALMRSGWFGRKLSIAGQNRLRVWEARRLSEVTFEYPAGAVEMQSEIGKLVDGALVLDGSRKGTGIYGPYLDLPAGSYRAQIQFGGSPTYGEALMDVTANCGNVCLAKRKLNFSGEPRVCPGLDFVVSPGHAGIEVRLNCSRGFKGEISKVAITPYNPPIVHSPPRG